MRFAKLEIVVRTAQTSTGFEFAEARENGLHDPTGFAEMTGGAAIRGLAAVMTRHTGGHFGQLLSGRHCDALLDEIAVTGLACRVSLQMGLVAELDIGDGQANTRHRGVLRIDLQMTGVAASRWPPGSVGLVEVLAVDLVAKRTCSFARQVVVQGGRRLTNLLVAVFTVRVSAGEMEDVREAQRKILWWIDHARHGLCVGWRRLGAVRHRIRNQDNDTQEADADRDDFAKRAHQVSG